MWRAEPCHRGVRIGPFDGDRRDLIGLIFYRDIKSRALGLNPIQDLDAIRCIHYQQPESRKTIHQDVIEHATGDVVNVLSSIVGDPNTTIHEGKAFTCNLRKGRLQRPQQGVART